MWAVMIGSVSAQKIGYVNLEAVLSLMPEMQNVNQSLETFSKELEGKLKIKQDYAATKYQEFLQVTQAAVIDTVRATNLQAELQKLQAEIQQDAASSEQELLAKRQVEMQPVITKLQEEVDKLAEAKGYNLILNAMDGSGVSIVLYAPDEHNLTKALLDQMDIELPEEGEGAASSKSN